MTDFEYDCLQKKRLARMAQYRKRGSKSKKCSLSTDNMTQKQWKERNGTVYTCNLNKPMSWDNFRGLSRNMQEEYIKHLIELYNINATSLSQMFNVKPAVIRRHIEQNSPDISFKVGSRMNTEQRGRWADFLSEAKCEERNIPAPILVHDQAPVQLLDGTQIPTEASRQTKMAQFSLVFEGKLDMSMIANSVLSIAGRGAEGRLQIICTLKD